jgi:hypothetical protein
MMSPRLPRGLYVITDPDCCAVMGLEISVSAAISGGARIVPYRAKNSSADQLQCIGGDQSRQRQQLLDDHCLQRLFGKIGSAGCHEDWIQHHRQVAMVTKQGCHC